MSPVCVLGVGSPLGDDQAGWLVIDALRACGVGEASGVTLTKLDRPGVMLLGHFEGASRVVLIDAMQAGGAPGEIRQLDEANWGDYAGGLSSHGVGVLDALRLAAALDALPPKLDLYGIEVGAARPGEDVSVAVREAATTLAVRLAAELKCATVRCAPLG
jgi:hydrogenase maturation protease